MTPNLPDGYDFLAELGHGSSSVVYKVRNQGFVHGAISPDHILLTRERRPKLAGFGTTLAHQPGGPPRPVGPVRYLPPEATLERSGRLGPGPDAFGLGAVLYQLLTGRPPYQAAASLWTLRRVVEHTPVPPSRLRAGRAV